jgi:hypothetical protein
VVSVALESRVERMIRPGPAPAAVKARRRLEGRGRNVELGSAGSPRLGERRQDSLRNFLSYLLKIVK